MLTTGVMRSALLPLSLAARSTATRPALVGTLYHRTSAMTRFASNKTQAEQPDIDVKNIGVPMGKFSFFDLLFF